MKQLEYVPTEKSAHTSIGLLGTQNVDIISNITKLECVFMTLTTADFVLKMDLIVHLPTEPVISERRCMISESCRQLKTEKLGLLLSLQGMLHSKVFSIASTKNAPW
jgi:hypothetical protein